MQLRWTSVRIPIVILAFSLAWNISAAAQGYDPAQSPDTPYDIQPFTDVDQDLFLVHGLRLIYTNWPEAKDAKQMAGEVAGLRSLASLFRGAAYANRVDGDLQKAYDDCLNLIAAYENYLARIGAIDRQTDQNVQGAAAGSILDGVGEVVKNKVFGDKSDQDAVNGATFDVLMDMLKRSISISQERQAAMQSARQQFQAQSNATLAAANATVQRLTRDRGWHPGEADLGSAGGTLSEQVNRRPRDPFALYALAIAADDHETAAGAIDKARYCVRGARLIPPGDVYNSFRTAFISQALVLMLDASNLQRSFYSGPATFSDGEALRLARTYLALNPGDASGYGRMQLARALAFNGRFNDALSTAFSVSRQFGNDPSFLYRYAKLLSLTGSVDQSAETLLAAYRVGWTNVADVRASPDFAALRRSRVAQFQQLTAVKVSPRIQFHPGWVDDLIVRNDSPFELTNVRVQAVIVNQGQTYRPEARAKSIKPGESYTASGATAIFGNRYDSFTYSITCDQCQ